MSTDTHCKVCDKKLRKNQRVLACQMCKCKLHLKCSRVTPSQYNKLKVSNFSSFTCKICSPNCGIVTSKNITNYLSSLTNQTLYHSIDILNKKLSGEPKGDLFVLHFNKVSLVTHKDSITSMISKMKVQPDVICVSESRLQDKKLDWRTKVTKIPNYKLIYDNSKKDAGGVAVYINYEVRDFKIKPDLKLKDDDCESIFFELFYNNKNGSKKNNVTWLCLQTPNLCYLYFC